MVQSSIQDCINKLEQIARDVKEKFSTLSKDQLMWNSSPGQWSIAQCLQHLIISNETYFPVFQKLQKGYNPGFWEKYNPFSHSTGKSMVESLGKKVKRKFKSPRLFLPAPLKAGENIIESFLTHQVKLITLIESLSETDPKKIMISSPVSPLITLSLHDCLLVISGHEERHLEQARQVMLSDGFPG
jgi:hypothetical protein